MNSKNADATINQVEFYQVSFTAKNDDVLDLIKIRFENQTQEDQVATARTPTLTESFAPKKHFFAAM